MAEDLALPALPASRPPIPVEWYGMSHFALWGTDRPAFDAHLDELRLHPPVLVYPEGYHGQVQNPIQWGPLVGTADPVYGDFFTPRMGDLLARGLAAPAVVTQRWDELRRYLDDMQAVTCPAPYVDFATQLYGHPHARLGFWAFWDAWDRYAAALALGTRPPDPSTWLRAWHTPTGSSVDLTGPAYAPDEVPLFRGRSFAYGPKQCLYCHPDDPGRRNLPDGSCALVPGQPCRYHRYSVCPATPGWMHWWRILIQKLAAVGFGLAFVDNCVFGACWNDACQTGYQAWLAAHYGPDERRRFFTVSTSLLANHSFEQFWAQDGPGGPWTTPYAAAGDGARLFPDSDSIGGRYAARVQGPGSLRLYPYPLTAPPQRPSTYELTVHYRTRGPAAARLVVREASPGNPTLVEAPLPDSPAWRACRVGFSSAFQVEVVFLLAAPGPLLVDELWLSVPGDAGRASDLHQQAHHRRGSLELPRPAPQLGDGAVLGLRRGHAARLAAAPGARDRPHVRAHRQQLPSAPRVPLLPRGGAGPGLRESPPRRWPRAGALPPRPAR